jgi:hypothetical protein
MTWPRRLRDCWCWLTGGHRLYWPHADPLGFSTTCARCGRVFLIDVTDLPRPRLVVPTRRAR